MSNILSSVEKSRNVSLLLIAASIICALLGLFTSNAILVVVAVVLAVLLYVFAMYYLDEHNVQGQSIKKHLLVLHFFALLAVSIAFLQFTRAPGMISYQTIHALADAFLACELLLLVSAYKNNLSNALVCVVGIVVFVLALLNVNFVLNIILACVGVFALVSLLKDSLLSTILSAVVAIVSILALLNKDTAGTHNYLHICAMIASLLTVLDFYKLVNKNVEEEVTISRSSINLTPDKNEKETINVTDVKIEEKDGKKTRTIEEEVVVASDVKVDEEKTKNKESEVISVSDADVDKKDAHTTRSVNAFAYDFDKSWFIKKYEDASYEDLLNAPLTAFKGVSQSMADDMKGAFNIKTIGDLAKNKFFMWAKEIVEEANK